MGGQPPSLISKLNVSADATTQLYSTQHLISDDCECEDCKFYVSKVLRYGFSIHAELSSAGVDVAKNLDSEPTGVWCVRDDGGKLLYTAHAYHIVGRLYDSQAEVGYQASEQGYNLDVYLQQIDDQTVRIDVTIRREKET